MAILSKGKQEETITTAESVLSGTLSRLQIIQALEHHHWDLERTIGHIFEGWQPPEYQPPPGPPSSAQPDPRPVQWGPTSPAKPVAPAANDGWGISPDEQPKSTWESWDSPGTKTNALAGWDFEPAAPSAAATTTPHRDPEPLPSSPTPVYHPTVIDEADATPSAPPGSPAMSARAAGSPTATSHGKGRATLKPGASAAEPVDLTGEDANAQSTANAGQGMFDADLQRAIQLSLAAGGESGPVPGPSNAGGANARVTSEDEAMHKALEESLAMSQSLELESFAHDKPHERVRLSSHDLPNPAVVRVDNSHLTFLPCFLHALYAAKPFRDRILALPFSRTLPIVPVKDELWRPKADTALDRTELLAKKLGTFNMYWCGDQDDPFPREEDAAGDAIPATPIEHVLTLQRLFALMTHTSRLYLDATELAKLLGYDLGNNISWPVSAPAKGLEVTWNLFAEVYKSAAYQSIHAACSSGQIDEMAARTEWSSVVGCMHWAGDAVDIEVEEAGGVDGLAPDGTAPMRMPMTTPDATFTGGVVGGRPDNATSCMSLQVGESGWGSNSIAGDIYACIDKKTYHPEQKRIHLLDNAADVIAFALERDQNAGAMPGGDGKGQFKVEERIWVDRYLLENRKRVCQLRMEVQKIKDEADLAFQRKAALQTHQGTNVVSTMKATCVYLERAKHPTDKERAAKQEALLGKYRAALAKLEAEIKALDDLHNSAYEASRAVFDIDEMKQIGPYDLVAAVVHDGFIGKDHMWTYVRRDEDKRWFKILNVTVQEVSVETVLTDSAGMHTGGGHVFLVYCRQHPSEPSSASVPIPTEIMAGVDQDNVWLEHELAQKTGANAPEPVTDAPALTNGPSPSLPTAQADAPTIEEAAPAATEPADVQMRSADSPRSDVADADIAELAEEDPMRLRGGAAEADDDDGEGSDEEEESYVELGFLKKVKKRLDPMSMTGKVGGAPIWINPAMPLPTGDTMCSSCGDPMSFLLQMNAPDDANHDAYLRAIYVFSCRRLSCLQLHAPGAVKSWRVQLPEQNPYYDASGVQLVQRQAEHDAVKRFREWEIVCDEEPDEETSTRPTLPEGVATGTNGASDPDGKDSKDSRAAVDAAFIHFQARLDRAPDQVLRYLRLSDPPAPPLWPSARGRPGPLTIPPCPLCRAARTPEFQIMSTVLSSLGVDSTDPDSLDFGTIVVYTCSRACSIPPPAVWKGGDPAPPSGWAPEVCFVQSFSSDGVDFRRPPPPASQSQQR